MRPPTLIPALLALMLSVPTVAEDVAPYVGTWRLDLSRSTFFSGPGPRGRVVTITQGSDGTFRYTSESVGTEGRETRFESTYRLDGKEVPLSLSQDETISVKAEGRLETEWVVRKAGKVILTGRTIYDRDGRTRRNVSRRTDAEGRTVESTEIYVRQ